ncbi:hypothetical protein AB6A40_001128 [Gnathostoma spinigerum]|uniref:Protein RFT1 homolog n=1 Tax=Gnathostoma spinigerum TaxID=75299 RepID=A0ABD6EAP4_9BILA
MDVTQSMFSSFASNFKGQLFSRIISFAINMYLLRRIDSDLLGVVNVSLTLFYTTSIFLVREPMRKTFLSSDMPFSFIVNHLWLSPLISAVISALLYVAVWMPFSTTPPVHVVPSYSFALFTFALSSWIESVAEPFVIVLLRFKLDNEYALLQGLLVVMQRVSVLALIFGWKIQHIDAFCWAQVLSSLFYCLASIAIVYRKLCCRSGHKPISFVPLSFRSLLPCLPFSPNFKDLSVFITFTGHSILKQVLADSSAYILTFTGWISLSNQAAYDSIEKLGSMVARIVLAPLEHSAYLCFSSYFRRDILISKQDESKIKAGLHSFSSLLHVTVVGGCVVFVFAMPYSSLVVSLYGGELLIKNSGATILRIYCGYIVIMAVNGITECFAMSTMNNAQLISHGRFLLFAAPLHLFSSAILSFHYAASGFVMANIINMLLRIAYSWKHTRLFLGERCPSVVDASPYLMTLVLLLFSLFVSTISLLIFGSVGGIIHNAAHVAIGGALFLFVINHLYQTDMVLRLFVDNLVGIQHSRYE